LGPVIQALYGLLETAERMHYCERTTAKALEYARTHGGRVKEYSDTICGRDYLDTVKAGNIKEDDILVQLSLDGAQLYHNKDSDCWIFVYIIHNLPPNLHYKKRFVIPAGFIPGPAKPKNTDSFLFAALYHISVLQIEGLRIWDTLTQTHIPRSIPYVFVTANGPAMAMVTGMVGHSGKFGCCLYCGLPGQHREGDGHYFPVMLKPNNYNSAGCAHDDITFSDLRRYQQDLSTHYRTNLQRLLGASNPSQYKDRHLETGLCKQTILSGL
jgi:Transposase family tnp2